eukprot:PhF_6_TR37471/c0_g1_i1/m.55178
MAEYVGMSLRDIYVRKCEELNCKKNSKLLADLPNRADYFDALLTLDLSTNYVGNKGLMPLLEVIRLASSLKSINLNDNQLTNEAVAGLTDILATHPSITALYLSNNPITIAAGQNLIDLAKRNPRLLEVSTQNTAIPAMMVRGLDVQLQHNKNAKDKADTRIKELAAITQESAESQNAIELKGDINRFAVRTYLASLPTTVHDYLLDEDPTTGIASLCAKESCRFVDTQFPPEPLSIQRADAKRYGDRGWKRLSEIYPKSKLVQPAGSKIPWETLKANSAMSTVWLWQSVVEASKSFGGSGNTLPPLFGAIEGMNPYGFYVVRFEVDGHTRFVAVDDYVPIGSDGKPIFMQPMENTYIWPCILEKAFAKILGSYQSLDAEVTLDHPEERKVTCSVIFGDLTGGVAIHRHLHTESFNPDDWWQTMLDMHENSAHLIGVTSEEEGAVKDDLGLERTFAYSIIAVRQINGHKLLRLHSPWASRTWLGDWGDRSSLWNQHNDIKQALDFRSKADSSFWMSYQSFVKNFAAVSIMRTFPAPKVKSVQFDGKWDRTSAGGPYFERSWERNPRYRLRLEERSNVFIHLSLPDKRYFKSDVDTIAFHVFRTDYFPVKYDKENVSAKTSYVVTNAVSFEGTLEAGEHWIVPSTYVPAKMAPYILRVVSKAAFSVSPEPMDKYWKETNITTQVESSGLFQCGEDTPQFLLQLPARGRPTRVVMRMIVPESDEYNMIFFVCVPQKSSATRMLGMIAEDSIVTKSKFLTTGCLQFECQLPGTSTPYIIVPNIQPEKVRATMRLSFWCSDPEYSVKEVPLWKGKVATGEWTSSGAYQDAAHNPQYELIPSAPNQTFVIKMTISGCNDPSIIFFVVNNRGRQGIGLKGPIADSKVATKSVYLRGDVVMKEFCVEGNPSDSYIIVPCLQPPGSAGKCSITVSCENEDYQFFQVLS